MMDLPSRDPINTPRSIAPAVLPIFLILQLFCVPAFSQALLGGAGGYDQLSARQKKIVSDYTAYLKQKANYGADPKQMYDALPESYRSTFEAVTNALEKTTLTVKSGGRSESALDLISTVEGIAGEMPGKRRDQQFRIYAAMRPGAMAAVARSARFRRGPDNTIYHPGYPLNYRMIGFPTIHFSFTADGSQADIDVEYQSSSFPEALIDGQVASANADVRASDNYLRHRSRWTGLDPWWENLATPGPGEHGAQEHETADSVEFPAAPPDNAKDLSDAVEAFLNTWLVLQQPNTAVAYFDNEALSCVNSPATASLQMKRMQLYHQLELTTQAVGKIDSLSEAILVAPSAQDAGADPIFEGFRIPDDQVAMRLCAPAPKENFKDVYLVSFRLQSPQRGEISVHQYWWRSDQVWKIVALRVERVVDETAPPVVEGAAQAPAAELASATGDPEMITAAQQFFQNWLMFRNVKGATAFLAPSAYQCFGRGKAATPASSQGTIMTQFGEIAESVPSGGSPEDAMRAVLPWDPKQAVVDHIHASAFAILQPTSSLLDSVRCAPSTHRGPVYITSFALAGRSEGGAALLAVWEPVDDQWMITSLSLLEP